MVVQNCLACQLAHGSVEVPGGLLHATTDWRVEHCVGPLGVGTFIVKPTRHVTNLFDLTDVEAAELGPLLRLTADVARRLTPCEQVYCCLWSHADGVAGHIHYVVQPVTTAQREEAGCWGPALQLHMFQHGETPDPEAVRDLAQMARPLFRSLPQQ